MSKLLYDLLLLSTDNDICSRLKGLAVKPNVILVHACMHSVCLSCSSLIPFEVHINYWMEPSVTEAKSVLTISETHAYSLKQIYLQISSDDVKYIYSFIENLSHNTNILVYMKRFTRLWVCLQSTGFTSANQYVILFKGVLSGLSISYRLCCHKTYVDKTTIYPTDDCE